MISHLAWDKAPPSSPPTSRSTTQAVVMWATSAAASGAANRPCRMYISTARGSSHCRTISLWRSLSTIPRCPPKEGTVRLGVGCPDGHPNGTTARQQLVIRVLVQRWWSAGWQITRKGGWWTNGRQWRRTHGPGLQRMLRTVRR